MEGWGHGGGEVETQGHDESCNILVIYITLKIQKAPVEAICRETNNHIKR